MQPSRTLPLCGMVSSLSENNITSILRKYNLSVPHNYLFSDRVNIVVGANGSGKTRFLKAIKDMYQTEDTTQVVYGYFPSLSDSRALEYRTEEVLPPITLYEYLSSNEASFDDLFHAIEQYGIDFISELLSYHSMRQKKIMETVWSGLADDFAALTGKEIHRHNNRITVVDSTGIESDLTSALELFSPGELMLFYMSVFLALQKNSSHSKRVIILDEPESHLHPKALLHFFRTLLKNHSDDTIWIATHSIFLLPELQFENIIYIAKGCITKKNSAIYREVYASLLGDENQNASNFFSSLTQWQYSQFMAECFTEPTVIETINPGDEQVRLFVEFINSRTKSNEPLRILDYGGGSARLGLSLKLADPNMDKYIEYDIFDPKPQYTGTEFTVYTKIESIHESYDCVVLMNVLHEIHPSEWQELFHRIYSVMRPDAFLVFAEVLALSRGEMPSSAGYLVLGIEELTALFKCNRSVEEVRLKEKQKTVCCIIPKDVVKNVTEAYITDAIRQLRQHSYAEVKKIRMAEALLGTSIVHDGKYARQYAFWSQQYINALLCLEKLDPVDDPSFTKICTEDTITLGCAMRDPVYKEDTVRQAHKILRQIFTATLSNNLVMESCTVVIDAINLLGQTGVVPDEHKDKMWKNIVELEKKRAGKKVIAYLLQIASLLGESRSQKYLYNNGYNKYIGGPTR